MSLRVVLAILFPWISLRLDTSYFTLFCNFIWVFLRQNAHESVCDENVSLIAEKSNQHYCRQFVLFFFIVCAPFEGRILSSVVVYKWPKAMTASVSLLISLNSLIRVQCAVINIRATINLRQIWFVSLMLLPVIISSYIPWERWREHTCEQRAYVCVRVRRVDVKAFDRRSVPSHRLKHRQVFFFSVVVEIFRIFFFMIWNFILILRRINSDERYVIWK